MSKTVNMAGFDELTDNLEEFVNKQGFTLGKHAETLQKLMFCISYCYINGVVTDSQRDMMSKKFTKQFKEALQEKESEGCENV